MKTNVVIGKIQNLIKIIKSITIKSLENLDILQYLHSWLFRKTKSTNWFKNRKEPLNSKTPCERYEKKYKTIRYAHIATAWGPAARLDKIENILAAIWPYVCIICLYYIIKSISCSGIFWNSNITNLLLSVFNNIKVLDNFIFIDTHCALWHLFFIDSV